MAIRRDTTGVGLHPFHAVVLGFPIALFSSALVADVAYLQTAEMQWSNFSAWLISGALLVGGLALAWAVISLTFGWRREGDRKRCLLYILILASMLALGLINIFKHSMDAWSSVETFGLILSSLCTLLALLAGAIALTNIGREVAR